MTKQWEILHKGYYTLCYTQQYLSRVHPLDYITKNQTRKFSLSATTLISYWGNAVVLLAYVLSMSFLVLFTSILLKASRLCTFYLDLSQEALRLDW
jgi:hypothetical protein